jgi:hypothetical protein
LPKELPQVMDLNRGELYHIQDQLISFWDLFTLHQLNQLAYQFLVIFPKRQLPTSINYVSCCHHYYCHHPATDYYHHLTSLHHSLHAFFPLLLLSLFLQLTFCLLLPLLFSLLFISPLSALLTFIFLSFVLVFLILKFPIPCKVSFARL